jgi:hypothetical protein
MKARNDNEAALSEYNDAVQAFNRRARRLTALDFA